MCSGCLKLLAQILGGFLLGKCVLIFPGDPRQMKDFTVITKCICSRCQKSLAQILGGFLVGKCYLFFLTTLDRWKISHHYSISIFRELWLLFKIADEWLFRVVYSTQTNGSFESHHTYKIQWFNNIFPCSFDPKSRDNWSVENM